jgi:hypothetical protein
MICESGRIAPMIAEHPAPLCAEVRERACAAMESGASHQRIHCVGLAETLPREAPAMHRRLSCACTMSSKALGPHDGPAQSRFE